MTSLWADGSPSRLAALARDLEARGVWHSYLSPQEHKLFGRALEIGPRTWDRFLQGQLPCQVHIVEEPTEEGHELQKQVVVLDSAILAFRVRYMLYVQGISFIYSLASDVPRDLLTDETAAAAAAATQPDSLQRSIPQEDEDYDDGDEHAEENEEEVVPEVLIVEVDEERDLDLNEHKDTVINYYRMYHTFEADREKVLRYKKLQESDRQMDAETDARGGGASRLANSRQFGAANLSLKHLLAMIDSKRDELHLTDVELHNLIGDARKNRSKWANEDRVGQEELYEACEKVVLELRATTEHSTAFLNRVSKREAPNYYQIITRPMDLNTVMKKLKTLQYNSKQEFVDDLMLIWQNCLTYNSDPKHFLRSHAIAMRKKTQALIPLIPDIVVRDRAEMEAEAQAEAEAEAEAEAHGTERGKRPVGKKRKVDKSESSETQAQPAIVGADDGPDSAKGDLLNPKSSDSISAFEVKMEVDTPVQNGETKLAAAAAANNALSPKISGENNTPDQLSHEGSAPPEEGWSPMADDEEINRQTYPDDYESSVWSAAFAKRPIEYLRERSELFIDNKLQMESPAPLRRPSMMAKFEETEELALRPFDERGACFETDSDLIMTEYEISAGMPPEPDSDAAAAQWQAAAISTSLDELPPTGYLSTGSLSEVYNRNLNEMLDIRRLCTKINLIRDMQANPGALFGTTDSQQFKNIADPEPDVESRLPGAERLYGPAAFNGMRRSAAKVIMHVGFEACKNNALDALADIAGSYLYKLARMLKEFEEGSTKEVPFEDYFTGALADMGISRLDNLAKYIADDVYKYNRRLREFKSKLTGTLTDLLRPTLELYKDEQFQDDSDQFVLGQFSNELGDDYFGLKELGIGKELGLDNIVVPFHLLHQRLAADTEMNGTVRPGSRKLAQPEYPPVTKESLPNLIGIVRPFFAARLADGDLEKDEKLSLKMKQARLRLPQGGKLSPRLRSISKAFKRQRKVSNDVAVKPEPDVSANNDNFANSESMMADMATQMDNNIDEALDALENISDLM